MYDSDSSASIVAAFWANFNQLDDVNAKLLKKGENVDLVAWSKACPPACIDGITDGNILQAMKNKTADLCALTSGISGIAAAFTYTTIFRFFVFMPFLLLSLNSFLHLVRPVVLLSSCLGRSCYSSGGSSSLRSLSFCLAARGRHCLVRPNSDIRAGHSSCWAQSSNCPHSTHYCPLVRACFLSHYPYAESNISQASRGPLPDPNSSSRTVCKTHFGLAYHLGPFMVYYIP